MQGAGAGGGDGLRAAVARVRHDLLTPLGGVIGYAAILLEDAAELGRPAMLPALGEIHDGARELSSAVSETLRLPEEPGTARPEPEAMFAALAARCSEPARGLLERSRGLLRAATPEDEVLVPDLRHVAESAAMFADLLGEAEVRLRAALDATSGG